MKFILGQNEAQKNIHIDIPTLLRSRMLIQANSGGGKSWLIRRILEQSHGKVQQIVIDIEGEFPSLREKYDYIHVGKGGDIAADVRSAGLLAERLLELNASAILDLYELKHYDRIQYAKLFLDAMVNVRKELWHPCIVVIDEAHVFAPEKGESVALSSVIDICTRGRKRSFCAILATQRLSKLHKDAAAECNNKLIGRTGLDIDVKRAAEEIGFTLKDDQRRLRQLRPGEFFAFGPAISNEVVSVTVGEVLTTHPDVGSSKKMIVVPPAPEKVQKMLSQLNDLPKEAEEKQKSLDNLKSENAVLKRKITELERQRPEIGDDDKQALIAAAQKKVIEEVLKISALADRERQEAILAIDKASTALGAAVKILKPFPVELLTKTLEVKRLPASVKQTPAPVKRSPAAMQQTADGVNTRILNMIATLNVRGITANRESVARWLGIHPNGGRYGTDLAKLRAEGFLDGFILTEKGKDVAVPGETGFDAALDALIDGTKKNILKEVKAGGRLSREELAQRLGIHPNGGRYGTDLAWLRDMGLIPERGAIELTEGCLT
jgi:hypothetical protein